MRTVTVSSRAVARLWRRLNDFPDREPAGRICAELGLSKSGLKRAIQELEEHNLLTVEVE